MREFSFIVKKEDEGRGIRKLLKSNFKFSSRLLTKLCAEKAVYLNDNILEGWMKPKEGDIIKAFLPDESSHFPESDIPIDVLWEDSDLLIINKQPHITVHPTKGHPDDTIANGLMRYMRLSNQKFKIRFINRLDMDTSGVLIIGKNSNAQDKLMQQMQDNKVVKRYIALVHGNIKKDIFTIDLPIGKPNPESITRSVLPAGKGKNSTTHIKVIERYKSSYGEFTLLSVTLETGRTHQIRVHLTHIGHPLLGDELYGAPKNNLITRQFLHASHLEFSHPVTLDKINVCAPLTNDLKNVINIISKENIKYGNN